MEQPSTDFEFVPPPPDTVVRRRRGPPEPRFVADRSAQLDPISGCPQLAVAKGHLAWSVREWVEELDTSTLERGYSSLGRHGIQPKRTLAVWLYASLIGVHHASKIARRLETDHAFRLLSGGVRISATVLRTFRREQGGFLKEAVDQTVAWAVERGLLDPEQLAVDAMRLQADASPKSVRTAKRSSKRLDELEGVDANTLSDAARAEHDAKVLKHREAVERCDREGKTSHSVTDPHAGLMKFPNGAALPGHRITATSCGTGLRFVVSVLINSKANDFGLLEEATRQAHKAIIDAGMPVRPGAPRMQIAADPGYLSEADLRFASENADWVDVLIHEPAKPKRAVEPGGPVQFGREAFSIHPDGSATCPAGQKMRGPRAQAGGRRAWTGVGCPDCALKPRCTSGKHRSLTQSPEVDRVHDAMRERMAQPDAKARYNQRIATVEPVFSYLQDTMEFRRSSSRKTETVQAEILLKVLAYNLVRLAAGRRLVCVAVAGVASARDTRILATWLPRAQATLDAAGRPATTVLPARFLFTLNL